MKIKQSHGGRRLEKYLLLLLLNLVTACSFAQVSITGKVSAKSTGSGGNLPAISVIIKGTTYGAGTDNSGVYKINAPIKPGNYTLVFSGVGYQQQEVPLTIGDAAAYTVDAQLSETVS